MLGREDDVLGPQRFGRVDKPVCVKPLGGEARDAFLVLGTRQTLAHPFLLMIAVDRIDAPMNEHPQPPIEKPLPVGKRFGRPTGKCQDTTTGRDSQNFAVHFDESIFTQRAEFRPEGRIQATLFKTELLA